MVGNDVVDLLDSDTDPGLPRDRFDARVCRPEERHAIASAADASRERWCHWAAKESAYKLLRKREGDTVFSPVRFEVDLQDPLPGWGEAEYPALRRAGRVAHAEHRIELAIECADGSVHAIATWPGANDGALLVARVRLSSRDRAADDRAADEGASHNCASDGRDYVTPAIHSRAVRQLALERIAVRLDIEADRLSITKQGRIPQLRLDGALCAADLSLSHHGRVVAFACRLPASAGIERLAS